MRIRPFVSFGHLSYSPFRLFGPLSYIWLFGIRPFVIRSFGVQSSVIINWWFVNSANKRKSYFKSNKSVTNTKFQPHILTFYECCTNHRFSLFSVLNMESVDRTFRTTVYFIQKIEIVDHKKCKCFCLLNLVK